MCLVDKEINMDIKNILSDLIENLDNPYLQTLSVIPWAAPIISFGDLSKSKIATLGLNPSNREFVDSSGNELLGFNRRFHTLQSLGIESWSNIESIHLSKIIDSCYGYFDVNPYDGWFGSLEKLFIDTNSSYYGIFSGICHLDLIPYATSIKWGNLSKYQKDELLKKYSNVLGLLIKESNIETIVMNGQSVIDNLQSISDGDFERELVSSWELPRRNNKGVTGYAYKGTIRKIYGVDLGREVLVLGYNHNIQSSFGVTTQVRTSIQKWISQSTKAVFC